MTNRQCSDWGGGHQAHLLQKFADPKVNASVAKEHFTKEGAVRSTILELVYLVHNLPIKEILKSENNIFLMTHVITTMTIYMYYQNKNKYKYRFHIKLMYRVKVTERRVSEGVTNEPV